MNAHELGSAVAVCRQQAIQQISEQFLHSGRFGRPSASNNTMVKAESDFQADNFMLDVIFGSVYEFAMAAAMNGIALHGGTRVYGGTFLRLLQTTFFQQYVWQLFKLLPVTML